MKHLTHANAERGMDLVLRKFRIPLRLRLLASALILCCVPLASRRRCRPSKAVDRPVSAGLWWILRRPMCR